MNGVAGPSGERSGGAVGGPRVDLASGAGPDLGRDPLRVHVVYEYGADGRPHASAHLRLLRPLTHPALDGRLDVTVDTAYDGQPVDVVIVDRLWRPDVTLGRARGLVDAVRRAGARLVYALDDNLLDLPAERADWPSPEQVAVVEAFLREADGVMVTADALAERLSALSAHVVVVPNALDERLLGRPGPISRDTPFGRRPLVIGYMGTPTHDDDLAMVLPALRAVCEQFPGEVQIEMVGVAEGDEAQAALGGLPVRFTHAKPPEREYPLFLLWFASRVRWDIAISPLRDTPFRRCKSDVKFLDYAAIGAAGVFSRVPAYERTVRHRETGWLADNTVEAWTEALTTLVVEEDLRAAVSRAATSMLFRERVLARSAPRWANALAAVADAGPGPAVSTVT